MTFWDRVQKGVVIFDGAMGTEIQRRDLPAEVWEDAAGCNELINLTAPAVIEEIHRGFLEAGADVIETNTFGANGVVLAEYALQDRTVEINRAAAQIGRRAVNGFNSSRPRYVAGSIGPGTRLISLGQIDFSTLYSTYADQARGLLEGGVDLLVIETCQDLLQIKAALLAVRDVQGELKRPLPVIVSVTIETSGTLLIGSDMSAVLAALSPMPVDILGMNCATGPEPMRTHLKQICGHFTGPVICQPNAGLPQNVDGEMVYTLPAEEFAGALAGFVDELGVGLVGGCCGTTPEYIAALDSCLRSRHPGRRAPQSEPSVASLFSARTLTQDPAPFFIGERTNTNGSARFRDCLLQDDWDGILAVARGQARGGAHGLDLCVAYTGRDEAADMREAASRIVSQVDLPLFIDSTDTAVIEGTLKLCGGRSVINSINLEDGEERTDRICRLARRYGAALIALTIDEEGMAHSAKKKLEIAQRIHALAVQRHGLSPADLIFDPLTFTLGSGDESMKTSAIETLEGIRLIKSELPGVFTNLGISNVSFGLNRNAREILNSVFLAEALEAGLDMAIVNVGAILPLFKIKPADIEVCLNLIYNRGGREPLLDFIAHFDAEAGIVRAGPAAEDDTPLEDRIRERVIQGHRSGIEKLLARELENRSAVEIINKILIPAMKEVGELFGAGRMQLPFVLQSAEVMKSCVDWLKPYMEVSSEQVETSIVLATVRGDVHDIGKNLVDIILSNNGYRVHNLGIKCEIETMIAKAEQVKADAIGMSGLLVKSTVVMKENLEEMQRRGIRIPVLLGGAALNRRYVEQVCSPALDSPVLYCEDAFDGLETMDRIKAGTLAGSGRDKKRAASSEKSAVQSRDRGPEKEIVYRDIAIPEPPFWGDRIVRDIPLETVYSYLTESVLFRGRWGYRRGRLSAEEYKVLIDEQVRPELERLKQRCERERLLQPAVVYGYLPCNGEGDDVVLYHPDSGDEWLRFTFPRQSRAPRRCIADYFAPKASGVRDLIALQVVTVGGRASEEAARLYRSNAYKDYLLFHGLSVEAAEALAEYWHREIRLELGIADEDGGTMDDFVVQKYRGSRYSFGYPACPDLAENRKLFRILAPERIGVTLSEEDQMIPEQTTSAFIVHHPQAKYFNV